MFPIGCLPRSLAGIDRRGYKAYKDLRGGCDFGDFGLPPGRIALIESFDPSRGRREVKIDAIRLDLILLGADAISLRGVE